MRSASSHQSSTYILWDQLAAAAAAVALGVAVAGLLKVAAAAAVQMRETHTLPDHRYHQHSLGSPTMEKNQFSEQLLLTLEFTSL